MEHNHFLSEHNLRHNDKLNYVLFFSILVNLLYVVIEVVIGLRENSLGLLSDAGHNLGDVFSLILTLLAVKLAMIPCSSRFTFGYKKSTIIVSVVNALMLLVAVAIMVVESIGKISRPIPVDGIAVGWTAAIGIIVNGVTAWFLMKYQKNDINVKGAFMHMLADAFVSLGVLVSGILINITGWFIIDAFICLLVSAVIFFSAVKLFREGLVLMMDGVPLSLDIEKIKKKILSIESVRSILCINVWAISTTENAMAVKLVVENLFLMDRIKAELREEMEKEGIGSCTIEMEIGK